MWRQRVFFDLITPPFQVVSKIVLACCCELHCFEPICSSVFDSISLRRHTDFGIHVRGASQGWVLIPFLSLVHSPFHQGIGHGKVLQRKYFLAPAPASSC
jgi:hypothetical protein